MQGMYTVVGFTGTRQGCTPLQRAALQHWMHERTYAQSAERPPPFIGLHGDCIGADAEFHSIARFLGWCVQKRPCTATPELHANTDAGRIAADERPMVRNRAIVHDADVMLACPSFGLDEKKPKGGTAATMGFARRAGKRLFVFWPSGAISEEGVVLISQQNEEPKR